AFLRTLRQLGIQPADWLEFSDHHRYGPREARYISFQAQAKGADALITTQKDVLNLCEECDDLMSPLQLYCLEVSLEIEREADFLGAIEQRIGQVKGAQRR